MNRRKDWWSINDVEVAKEMIKLGFDTFHLSDDGHEVVAKRAGIKIFHSAQQGGIPVSISYLTNECHLLVTMGNYFINTPEGAMFSGRVVNFVELVKTWGLWSTVESIVGHSLKFDASIEPIEEWV